MSKTSKTTKTATFLGWQFEAPQGEYTEVWGEPTLTNANAHECVGAMTTSGLVAGTNTFTSPNKGDRVVLRKGAPRSYTTTAQQWVMTNLA